jgi:uncharacterized membrane protein YcaP (DUF421 family)
MHLQKEDKLEEVQEGNLEPSGRLSILKKEPARTVQKKDLPRLEEILL